MAAREFRGPSASTEETFSPTTLFDDGESLDGDESGQRFAHVSALDASDACLQVLQREDVVVSVPNWVKVAAGDLNLMFWQLLKCLPGQRDAATRWNEHLTNLLGEPNFGHMHGTLFRHRERDIFLSAHIDDPLLIANKENTEEIFEKLSKIIDFED